MYWKIITNLQFPIKTLNRNSENRSISVNPNTWSHCWHGFIGEKTNREWRGCFLFSYCRWWGKIHDLNNGKYNALSFGALLMFNLSLSTNMTKDWLKIEEYCPLHATIMFILFQSNNYVWMAITSGFGQAAEHFVWCCGRHTCLQS